MTKNTKKKTKNTYQIEIKFKNGNILNIRYVSKQNPRELFRDEWVTCKKDNAIEIGEYIITLDEILWIKVEGETIEKHSGQ